MVCFQTMRGSASFYKLRAKYGGMDASRVSPMKAMEEENRRLKRVGAELGMQADLLKVVLGKIYCPPRCCKGFVYDAPAGIK